MLLQAPVRRLCFEACRHFCDGDGIGQHKRWHLRIYNIGKECSDIQAKLIVEKRVF